MLNHIITIGLFDRKARKQEISTENAIDILVAAIMDHNFCATIESAGVYGVYRHDDGSVIVEPSIRLNIAGETRNAIIKFINELIGTFNQESIMYEMRDDNIIFQKEGYTEALEETEGE